MPDPASASDRACYPPLTIPPPRSVRVLPEEPAFRALHSRREAGFGRSNCWAVTRQIERCLPSLFRICRGGLRQHAPDGGASACGIAALAPVSRGITPEKKPETGVLC